MNDIMNNAWKDLIKKYEKELVTIQKEVTYHLTYLFLLQKEMDNGVHTQGAVQYSDLYRDADRQFLETFQRWEFLYDMIKRGPKYDNNKY